eukprot:jgi/Picsp_1/2101/NSC_05566-R1_---NA---
MSGVVSDIESNLQFIRIPGRKKRKPAQEVVQAEFEMEEGEISQASAVINDQNGIIGVGPGILKYHVDAVRLEAAMDIKGENDGALKIALLNVSKSK